jgi:gliding motility associated protien GldN
MRKFNKKHTLIYITLKRITMKKGLLFGLCVTLGSSMTLMAQNTKVDTAAKLAQVKATTNDDGYFNRSVLVNARPFDQIDSKLSNVRLYHRYWRDIDLKDAKNQKFAIPGNTVIEALLKAIKDGSVTPFDATSSPANPSGDAFTIPLTYNQLMGHLRDTAMVNKLDKDGNIVGTVAQLNDFSADKVVGYRLKEDVYYDKQRARVETRIVGIAPIITIKTSNGDTLNRQPICWFKFKECRAVFAKMDVSDPDKNMYDVSMDDMFLQRRFDAKMIKQSNPTEERIKDYMKDPADQAKEAQRLEAKLANFKKNVWSYSTTAQITNAVADNSTSSKKAKKSKVASTDINSKDLHASAATSAGR